MRSINYFLVCTLFLLTACSQTPADSRIAALLAEQHENTHLATVADLGNVRKLNGFAETDQVYIADIRYTLTVKVGSDQYQADRKREKRERFREKSWDERRSITWSMINESRDVLGALGGSFDINDTRDIERKVTLHKTENGWIIHKIARLES